MGGGGGGGGAGGGGPPQDGIPQMAQLKACRACSKKSTNAPRRCRDHPKVNQLTPAEQRELLGIRKDQQDVADLLDEVTAPGDEPEPEKKPAEKPVGEKLK